MFLTVLLHIEFTRLCYFNFRSLSCSRFGHQCLMIKYTLLSVTPGGGRKVGTTHLHVFRDCAFQLLYFVAILEIHESWDLEIHNSS